MHLLEVCMVCNQMKMLFDMMSEKLGKFLDGNISFKELPLRSAL